MLESLGKDGRARSRFFCGGKRRESDLSHRLAVRPRRPASRVTLVQPLWSLVAWLADEERRPPTTVDLRKRLFQRALPSATQIKLAQAVLDGFLLTTMAGICGSLSAGNPHDSRREPVVSLAGTTGKTISQDHAISFRSAFAPSIAMLASAATTITSSSQHRHRAFIDRHDPKLLDMPPLCCALAIEQTFPGAVLARFEGWILCKGKPKQRAEIHAQLAAAFPSATLPTGL